MPRVPPYRQDITFESYGETISGWLYPSRHSNVSKYKGPAIVLAHGLGCVKEMGLDAYSELFHSQGYTCLAFDYRCHGASTGLPRGLINVGKQLNDWKMALKYVRGLSYVKREEVGIFGTSFGGANVIRVAARDPTIKATICQNPFTSGLHSALTTGFSVIPELAFLAIQDKLFGTDVNPVCVSLAGPPGTGEITVSFHVSAWTEFPLCCNSRAHQCSRRHRRLSGSGPKQLHPSKLDSRPLCPRDSLYETRCLCPQDQRSNPLCHLWKRQSSTSGPFSGLCEKGQKRDNQVLSRDEPL